MEAMFVNVNDEVKEPEKNQKAETEKTNLPYKLSSAEKNSPADYRFFNKERNVLKDPSVKKNIL